MRLFFYIGLCLSFLVFACGEKEIDEPKKDKMEEVVPQPAIGTIYVFDGVKDLSTIKAYVKEGGNISEIALGQTLADDHRIFNEYETYTNDTFQITTETTCAIRHLQGPSKDRLDTDNAVVPFALDEMGWTFTTSDWGFDADFTAEGDTTGFQVPYSYFVIKTAAWTWYKELESSEVARDPFDLMEEGDTVAVMTFDRSFIAL